MEDGFDPDAPRKPGSARCIFGLPSRLAEARVVVIEAPWDATSGGGEGSSLAPDAVVAASYDIGLRDLDTGDPWRHGIALQPADRQVVDHNRDASGAAAPVLSSRWPGQGRSLPDRGPADPQGARIASVDRACEALNGIVQTSVDRVLERGAIPAILGGDHSVAYGAIASAAARSPGIGVLHIGARAHLHQAYQGFAWSYASTMFNVRTSVSGLGQIVQVGLRDVSPFESSLIDTWDDVQVFTDADLTWALAGGGTW